MRSISPLPYRWPFPAKLFFFALLIVSLAAPIPFIFFRPGNPNDLAGGLLKIPAVKTYPLNGHLYITSILVTNPNTPVLGAEALYIWGSGGNVVVPRESLYPAADDDQVIRRDSRQEMASSKVTSTAAALSYLGYKFEPVFFISEIRSYSKSGAILQPGDRIMSVDGKRITDINQIRPAYADRKIGDVITLEIERQISGVINRLAIDVELIPSQEPQAEPDKPAIGILVGTSAKFPFQVELDLRGVGGPSAGLIFAVGIVDKLTPEDLMRGRRVAGTGAINPAGKVGGIGGIEQKMIGAANRGATIFLAPRENCPDIQHIPKGLKVIPVSTLEEAIAALRAPDGSEFPTC